uniref:Uncharacterized protein n=1 Tax=Hemiselmis andersenii TaxID=464988 RepID=A0A6U4SMD4_HEMAN
MPKVLEKQLSPTRTASHQGEGGPTSPMSAAKRNSVSGSFKMLMGLMFTDAAHVVFDKHGTPPQRPPTTPANASTEAGGEEAPPLKRESPQCSGRGYTRGSSDPMMIAKPEASQQAQIPAEWAGGANRVLSL